MRLSALEIDILRTMFRGEIPSVSPAHRVRLELLGLTRETPTGLRLTSFGERYVHLQPTVRQENLYPPEHRVHVSDCKAAADRILNRFGL
jgi:hypothetical protein